MDEAWLRKPEWRARVIVHGKQVRGLLVAVLWLIVPTPFALMFAMSVAVERFDLAPTLFGATAFFSFIAALPTYLWLRHRRYGASTCRLLTLPGTVGGRFEADVLCALPADDEPVFVRLINYEPGKRPRELWRMEQQVVVPVIAGKRALVPVRFDVPRHRGQETASLNPGWKQRLLGEPFWLLKIDKKAKGVDFHADFHVPIYDLGPPAS